MVDYTKKAKHAAQQNAWFFATEEGDILSWQRYEREVARKHNGRHVGGPGRPDYQRGSTLGEVKHRQTPVTKPELIRLRKKGVTEIHSLNGFTDPAIAHVAAYSVNMKLYSRGRRVI